MNNDKEVNNTRGEEYNEPFSESADSIEFKKEKRIYNLCIIFLPILILILILSIIIYFFLKEPTNKDNLINDERNENITKNYTIIEKISVDRNDSKPILLFNVYYTKLKEKIISIKINNKEIQTIDNYYVFNFIGDYTVEITFNKKLESMEEIFLYCAHIVELDLSQIDTSLVTTMKEAFYGCTILKKINFDNINTSLVTDMSNMFKDCKSLTSLDLSNFNTSLVKDMSYMFYSCNQLQFVNVSRFNTENVYKMEYMFYSCNLSSLDVLNFNTRKTVYIQYMFSKCGNLTSLNISNFDTREVVDFSGLFNGNLCLEDIDISHLYTNKMNFCNDMFVGLPINGIITINMFNTNALILNQIPYEWKIRKYFEDL
jgi:surface protein